MNKSLSTIRLVGKAHMSIWSKVKMAPPDKILGITEMFLKDEHPQKLNLGVGAYRDDSGKPVILDSVREAEKRVQGMNHEYAPIDGFQPFIKNSLEFGLGKNSPYLTNGKVAAAQCLSGTGGLRLIFELLATVIDSNTTVYLPTPTWGNHAAIVKKSGLNVEQYSYYNSSTNQLDFELLKEDLSKAKEGSVVLLHACAHNPTGCDPSMAQWQELNGLIKEKKLVPFFDCAYQGFSTGDPENDAQSIRLFAEGGHPTMLLAQSYSKSFGLYGERVGCVSVLTSSEQEALCVLSQMKSIIRPMYSNPPLFGARIIHQILSDPKLKEEWHVECRNMADRIKNMRVVLQRHLVDRLESKHNWDHITSQAGMFCYTGLTKEQVEELRTNHHVYCTDDGRISMAGVASLNVAYLADSMHAVTK